MSAGVAAYRHLLRVVRSTFKGDGFAQAKAHDEIRARFEAARHLVDDSDVQKRLEDARDAANCLQDFVVQAALNDRGSFRIKVQPHQAEAMKDINLDSPDNMKIPK
eukprot:evm.model.scf_561EXC.7 EVM.evm.TU.scf_561EXC.7   scf_561EXC:44806-48196(-)